jgi:phosphoglycolate phosphatase-like HAD superfamily hydrolase
MNNPNTLLIAFDFDGVICDGLREYFQTSWRCYCDVWGSRTDSGGDEPSQDLAEAFYRLRPVVESGWEMPLLIRALVMGIAEADLFARWETIAPEILAQHGLESKRLGQLVDSSRDQSIAQDPGAWLDLHRFYPGILDRLRVLLADPQTQAVIVTTKEARFVEQLLGRAGLDFPADRIYGKGMGQPKYETLRQLIAEQDIAPRSVQFIEDRLKALELVAAQSDLADVQLILADWGYNTAAERDQAQASDRILSLSLEQLDRLGTLSTLL